jgi:DNA replication regulator DPB11
MCNIIGISHAPTFSRSSTHLLCPTGKGLKFERAKEWGKPVIGMDWLQRMATTGAVPPIFDYLVLYPVGEGAQVKGKQKAQQESADSHVTAITIGSFWFGLILLDSQ